MNFKEALSGSRLSRQKKTLYAALIIFLLLLVGVFSFLLKGNTPKSPIVKKEASVDLVSSDVNHDNMRLAELEKRDEIFANEFEYMKSKINDLSEEKSLKDLQLEKINTKMSYVDQENKALKSQIDQLRHKQREQDLLQSAKAEAKEFESLSQESEFNCWTVPEENESDERHIKYEIPPGTLVKGIIVQGVSQPVGVGKPASPEVALIRITSAGKLPKKLRLALKGSNLICSTESILSNRRIRVRGETMSKHKKNGSFVVTDVSAVISGPGGKTGVPARVLSYGGVQAGYGAIASTLGAATEAMHGVLNNQYITQLAQTAPTKTILNSTDFTNVGARGMKGGFDKITDYYIKMAELYSPVLEIDMGTEVSILFTTTVTLGEKNIRKRLNHERVQNDVISE